MFCAMLHVVKAGQKTSALRLWNTLMVFWYTPYPPRPYYLGVFVIFPNFQIIQIIGIWLSKIRWEKTSPQILLSQVGKWGEGFRHFRRWWLLQAPQVLFHKSFSINILNVILWQGITVSQQLRLLEMVPSRVSHGSRYFGPLCSELA